jgi:hypothetical protein
MLEKQRILRMNSFRSRLSHSHLQLSGQPPGFIVRLPDGRRSNLLRTSARISSTNVSKSAKSAITSVKYSSAKSASAGARSASLTARSSSVLRAPISASPLIRWIYPRAVGHGRELLPPQTLLPKRNKPLFWREAAGIPADSMILKTAVTLRKRYLFRGALMVRVG